MNSVNKKFLAEVIKDGLRNEIGPLLTPGRARLVMQIACELIDDLAGRELPDACPLPAELAARMDALARELGVSHGSAGRTLAGLAARAASAPAQRQRIAELLSSVAAFQERHIHELPSLQSAFELSASGSLGNQPEPRATTSTLLERYLQRTSPLGAEFTVASVRRLSAGMSKETYVADFNRQGGGERRLIIRKDGVFSSLTTTVVDEFPLLKHLSQFDLPAPTVLKCESDRAICGAPFMLVEPICGTADPSTWNDAATLRAIGLQMAQFLAKLHAVPTADFVANTPPWLDPLHMCRSVKGMRAAWAQFGSEPQPLMVAVLEWLEANEPRVQRQPVLVHGDIGLWNLLIDGKTVSGVLDWEMCHLGQPDEDLLCARQFLGEALPWEEFLAAYRSHGGNFDGTTDARFLRVFTLARIALSLFHVQHSIGWQDPSLDTKETYIGARYTQRVVLEAFKQIAATQ
jgi:aminoglycoside phosphotransferase (APT) family kinase protein